MKKITRRQRQLFDISYLFLFRQRCHTYRFCSSQAVMKREGFRGGQLRQNITLWVTKPSRNKNGQIMTIKDANKENDKNSIIRRRIGFLVHCRENIQPLNLKLQFVNYDWAQKLPPPPKACECLKHCSCLTVVFQLHDEPKKLK